MTYRLIALDIDGTIRNNNCGVSERTKRAVWLALKAGAFVTVATGRMFRSAVESTTELQLTSPIVSFQGAVISNPVSGKVLWNRPLTEDLTLSALKALSDWEGVILASVGDYAYVNMSNKWVDGYRDRNNGRVRIVENLVSIAHYNPTRLVAVGETVPIFDLEKRLNVEFLNSLHVTRSLPTFCELLHPEAGKHKALEWLRGYLKVSSAETVAFGNGYNDVEMLKWAHLGVAIGDAVPEVLDVADIVAPSLEENGAAQIIEQLLEQGLVGNGNTVQ